MHILLLKIYVITRARARTHTHNTHTTHTHTHTHTPFQYVSLIVYHWIKAPMTSSTGPPMRCSTSNGSLMAQWLSRLTMANMWPSKSLVTSLAMLTVLTRKMLASTSTSSTGKPQSAKPSPLCHKTWGLKEKSNYIISIIVKIHVRSI